MNSKFNELLGMSFANKQEKIGGATYLSWSHAWEAFKKTYEDATYVVIEAPNGMPWFYDANLGYMVRTSVTAGGETHEMWLPVMDSKFKAMKDHEQTYEVTEWKNGVKTGGMIEKKIAQADMHDINRAIMRCLTKNLAMFGLGLYLYHGEDLPTVEVANTKLVNASKDAFLKVTESTALAEKYDEIKAHLAKVKANELTQKSIEELYNARSEELLNENA